MMAPIERMARWSVRAGARAIVGRRLNLHVAGLHHLPRSGPLLIASRHYHHLYDGAVLLSALPRPVQLLVALDWTTSRRGRCLMEWACATARWPVVLRTERIDDEAEACAFRAAEGTTYLRRAIRDSVDVLRAGRVLVVFPEGYPTVDPHRTPKASDDDFLPFRPGFMAIVEHAQRDGRTHVPIVPAGFSYRRSARWNVTLRFGPPFYLDLDAGMTRACLRRVIEEQVKSLSSEGS